MTAIKTFGVTCLAASFLAACQTTPSKPIETIVPKSWERNYKAFHYAPAVKAGDFLFLSGVVASEREGKTEEEIYTRAFETMENILAEGGATWEDVVEIQTFHTDLPAQFPVFAAVKDRYIKEPYPAWTAIDIDRLFPDNGVVEIKLTAYLGSK